MNITHVSDLHGSLDALAGVYWPTDLWVFSGDILPDAPIGDRDSFARYQRNWFRRNAKHFRAAIGDAPVLVVDGNHDFAFLSEEMTDAGMTNVRDVTVRARQIMGHGFAGFGYVPYDAGRWSGEVGNDMLDRASVRSLASGADVLVTHCPPAGILDAGLGNAPLAARLKGDHNVKLHLFGHVHEHAGEEVTIDGVRYCNGALGARLVVL